MKKFQQSEYVKQAEKWVRQRNGGQLSMDELKRVHEDAETHIGNLFPEWNNWDEVRQVEELGKLDKRSLRTALQSCVDGGNRVAFALPSAVSLALLERLQEPLTPEELKLEMNGYRDLCAAKGFIAADSEENIKKRAEASYNEAVESVIRATDRYDGMTLLEKTAYVNKEDGVRMNKILHRAIRMTYTKKEAKSAGLNARLKGRSVEKPVVAVRRKRGSEGR